MRGDLSVSLSIYLAIYEKTVRAAAGPWVAYETKGKIKLGTRGECHQSETMARRSVLLRLPLLLLNAASAANNASLVNSLRRHLLTDLDPKVAPSTPDGGLVTKVQFRIFKVISVDVSSGALVLKVWRRVRWFDERLAWDPAKFEGLRTVLVYPSGGHTSLDDNLWLPHVVVYNALKADHAMFESGAAWVRFDGRVHWSVPGTIEITCRFSGLVNFPNDELTVSARHSNMGTPDLQSG
jgi:hypothetical protein